jgi:hypothetical protein
MRIGALLLLLASVAAGKRKRELKAANLTCTDLYKRPYDSKDLREHQFKGETQCQSC